jgi:ribosomal-protein-alanine acetyltransferase
MYAMPVIIEDVSIRHLDRLYEIEKECFKEEAFTKEQIAQLLSGYNSISLVARVDSRIAGFVIGMIYVDRNALHGHILTIDVSPAYRRKGIGQKLLQEIEKIFRQKDVSASHLEVREDNVAAINLYRKLGYEKIGRLKNYYGNAHGVYLKKTLA